MPSSTDSKKDDELAKTSSANNTDTTGIALKAYKAVLQSKTEFYNTNTKKNIYFNNFLTNNGIFDTTLKALNFIIMDMDGDKIPEVIVGLSVGDNNYAEFYEVLHYTGSKVYGYIFSNRELGDIKTDGTFGYSSGSSDNGFGKLKFQDDTRIVDPIGYKKSKGSDYKNELYFIGDKQVTSDQYKVFENEQLAKKEPAWNLVSQDNIQKEFSAK